MSTEFRNLQSFTEKSEQSQCEYVIGSTRHKISNICLYYENNRAYEYIKCQFEDEQKYVPVHRLVAVAEFGIEAVKNMETHHKNDVSWDNRPDNIMLLSSEEHRKRHKTLRHRLESTATEHISSALEEAGYPEAARTLD